MRHMQRIIGTSTALALCLCLLSQAPGDVADDNRSLLEKYRQDEAHFARLQQDLTLFLQLAPERQERLRKLDSDLQDETNGMRTRLQGVMQRYADWLDRLPEADRQAIERAPDRKAKLNVIRDIRERQWIKRLPKAQQELVAKATGDDRAKLLTRLRQEEAEQRAEWQAIARNADLVAKRESGPARFEQLPDDVKKYVTDSLMPLLSKDEERRLHEAEGQWPRYMRVLVDLLDSHPLSVQGPIGPTRIDDPALPKHVREMLERFEKDKSGTKYIQKLNESRGKWPDFVVAIQRGPKGPHKMGGTFEQRYMPSQPQRFPKAIQVFLEKRLLPALDRDDQDLLARADHWPAYPRQILELARKHNLPVPLDKPLPGPFDFYDKYRQRSVTPELASGGR